MCEEKKNSKLERQVAILSTQNVEWCARFFFFAQISLMPFEHEIQLLDERVETKNALSKLKSELSWNQISDRTPPANMNNKRLHSYFTRE